MAEKSRTPAKPVSFISSYGFFWERSAIDWSKSFETAKLLGVRRIKKKNNEADCINFAKQIGLYALYDDDHELVYFGKVDSGINRSLYARLKEHTTGHLNRRWTQFSWFGTTSVKKDNTLRDDSKSNCQGPTEAFLNQLEAIVIAISNPPSNKRGGSFVNADQYYQFKDPSLPLSYEEKIDQVFEMLKRQQS